MFSKIVTLFCLLVVGGAVGAQFGAPKHARRTVYGTSRIVGGVEAKPHEFPSIVSLQIDDMHFCGGNILNENWILTAAHCVADDFNATIVVKAGKHLILVAEETEQTSVAAEIIVHEKYEGEVKPFDIALIKLETPFVFNEYVQPIALPKKDSEVEGDLTIAGWGIVEPIEGWFPDELLKANVPVVDLYSCKKALNSLSNEIVELASTNICTGPLSGGISHCEGDSGGPLIDYKSGKSEIVGITSWGYVMCGVENAPSVYTKVSSYIDWIDDVMASN